MRDISLPLARPALAVGVALALLKTLNDIGASEYLGMQTITLSVFNHLAQSRQPPRRGPDRTVHACAYRALIAL